MKIDFGGAKLFGAVVAALALGSSAAQAVEVSMAFTGVVSPGSSGGVFPYGSEPLSTSFDGQPVQISLTIAGEPGALYVSGFSMSWSQASYSAPFITGWSGPGLPQSPDNDLSVAFYSNVSLGADGGSIQVFPTDGFLAATDADFDLDFSYSFSQPQNPYGAFTDSGLTGSGSFGADEIFLSDPILGNYDASSSGQFSLSRLAQTIVPEPSTWAMLVLGACLVGLARRFRPKAALPPRPQAG
ncbi:MAG TPA: PEP-CTERM sorting domain-containing protein [Caulobacteraceae bacterium]|jgi:hypothetical protein